MEICQCERYKTAVQNAHFYSLGTVHPLRPRIQAPKGSCVLWKCIKANHEELQPTKPVLIEGFHELEQKDPIDEPLESKWIPVSPGVISQKIVNESKKLKCPF